MPPQQQTLEDKVSEKEYFQFLRAELVQQISTQLSESEKLVDGFLQQLLDNTPDDFNWMWDEAPTESAQKKKAIFELRDRLSDRAVVITGIQFPASDTELKGEYQRLLSGIPRLELWRCDFYGDSLLPDQEACITYSNCTFHSDWKITASRSKDADQSLFEQCCSKRKVELVEDEPGFAQFLIMPRFLKTAILRT